MHSQRFPHPAGDHMDADERKAAASRGASLRSKGHPPGGIKLTGGEWRLLLGIVIIAAGVRLFKLSHPNSVVCVFYPTRSSHSLTSFPTSTQF